MSFGHDVEELGKELPDFGMLYALDESRKIIRTATETKKYYCFICSQTDNAKVSIAYDDRTGTFKHSMPQFHSTEILWYFNTKDFLKNLVQDAPMVEAVKDGAKLSSPETRADIYAKTSSGKTVAFEIQQPKAGKQTPVRTRHRGYEAKNIHDQWIYSPHAVNPFFSYDFTHGLVADPYRKRLGIIVVKANPLFATEKDSVVFAHADDKELAYTTKYACWTDAEDWSMSDTGMIPIRGSSAHDLVLVIEENQNEIKKRQNLQNTELTERFEKHKDEAVARAKKRGIDPDRGHEVFIPPLDEPPYPTYPLTYGMLIEQAAYMAHTPPLDYIKNVLSASHQWDAYVALRNRWEDTGKYDKSTFPDFEMLKKN